YKRFSVYRQNCSRGNILLCFGFERSQISRSLYWLGLCELLNNSKMEDLTLARVIHIVAVVLWIGGVAMVTTVIIPAVKKMKTKEDQLKTFEEIEGRFALQAKITTLLTGLSGFYMLYKLDAWNRYLDYRFWWIHAMTLV